MPKLEVSVGSEKSSQMVLQPCSGTGQGQFHVGPLENLQMHPMKYQYVTACLTQTTLMAERELQIVQTGVKRYSAPPPLMSLPFVLSLEDLQAAG